MNKQEVQQRVLQNGKPLDLDKFEWNVDARVFSTTENNLVIDFNGIHNCTFKTGSNCMFKTGFNCTFDTGSVCTFKTGPNCTFDTEKNCVVVRRDVYEIIELTKGKKIKLNGCGIKGYTIVNTIEKMTVRQICEELGREIEIIKE